MVLVYQVQVGAHHSAQAEKLKVKALFEGLSNSALHDLVIIPLQFTGVILRSQKAELAFTSCLMSGHGTCHNKHLTLCIVCVKPLKPILQTLLVYPTSVDQ